MRQLIFTSALAGLAPGRSGFCTVARHASLRERLVAELERMSEYKPPSGTRPTVFMFRIYSGGNEPLYILTRAGDAGKDGFGRPNYVVHHLIFQKNELSQLLPPAEVALRFRGWCEKFEGEPRFLPEDETLPPEILRKEGESLLPAKRWEALTGDAGNAALLCPRGEPRATVFLGDETWTETVLGLFAEAAEAMGRDNAWSFAFSTGICSQGAPGRFLWRRVEESQIAVRHPGDLILDFLAPLEFLHAPRTQYAEFARTGVFPAPSKENSARAEEILLEHPAFPRREEITETKSAALPHKRFADIAGTAKFLGISLIVVVLVISSVVFWGTDAGTSAHDGKDTTGAIEVAGAYRKILDQKIAAGDFVGAAETWCAFVEAKPLDARRVAGTYLPRFKLKVSDAYAKRFAARLAPTGLGVSLTAEEIRIVAAELAMFRRVCEVLELTPQRLQKKNLAVFERAEALVKEAL